MDSIIFDVDGTLWDSADSVAAAWNLAIKKFSSLDITLDREILGSVFGKTMTDIGDILFPSLSETEKDSLLSACCELENNYLKNHPGIIYEGVADTIEKLSKKYPLFIVSNCQAGYIEVFLEYYHLGDLVADIECYGNTQQQKDANLKALIERNHYEKYYYLGDTQGDYNACRKAGVPFLFAAYGFGTVDADVPQVESLEQLPEIIKNL